MPTLSAVAIALLLLPAQLRANDKTAAAPSQKPFGMKFIGEGGGSSLPNAEASGAIETGARQEGAQVAAQAPAQETSAPAKPALQPKPAAGRLVPLHPALTRPRPSVPRPARSGEPVRETQAQPDADRRRYSLWDGLAAPMDLPPQKVKDVSADQAAALGRRDYDTHILSQREAVPTSAAAPAPIGNVLPVGRSAPREEGAAAKGSEVFVTLNLDLKKSPDASLKDAVADLGRVAGFRQDGRFAPAAIGAGPDQVALWGWMAPGLLGEAMKVPAVTRIELNAAGRRAQAQTGTDVLVGLRVPRGGAAAEVISRLEADLAASGLRIKRSIGTQTAPGTGETVLVVEAAVPISALSRLMSRPDVVKVLPTPQPPAAPDRAKREPLVEFNRFLSFVMANSPMLLVLTLIMLLPWVGSALVSAARVFIPYR